MLLLANTVYSLYHRYCKVLVKKGDGTLKQCGFKFEQTVGQMSTGSLNFHFKNHHPEIVKEVMPEAYEKWVKDGTIKKTQAKNTIAKHLVKNTRPEMPRPPFWGVQNIGTIQELACEILLDKLPPSLVERRGRMEAIRYRLPW